MRIKYVLYTIIVLAQFTQQCVGQTIYKGFPLIKASSSTASYRIGNDWIKNEWTISPSIESDSLMISCHHHEEDFTFYTNQDSIKIRLSADQICEFYILLNDTSYARTVVKAIKPEYHFLNFDTITHDNQLEFLYAQSNNEYLIKLRQLYPIDSIVKGLKTDTARVFRILNWVHNQWEHDGDSVPKKNDAISILEEAKKGQNFRCVEYGVVTAACLNSIGLKSRVLALRTKDVETTQYGAGHVLAEVYLNDMKKWVLLDGQWNVMPVLNGIPLNAVELQKAITENYQELEIRTTSGISKRQYVDWIYPYLYYFEIDFDNREGENLERKKIEGKSSLMLVPIGAKKPTIFQIIHKINYDIYTNSIVDFYSPPSINK